jgi:hypothetical protein
MDPETATMKKNPLIVPGLLTALCLLNQTEVLAGQATTEAALAERITQLEAQAARPGILDRMAERDVLISGSGAAAFFSGDAENPFSEDEFRIDEARVFIDARLLPNAFFFGELMLTQRESKNKNVTIGELYIDWENPFTHLLGKRHLNFRFGRFDIPFGEEYLLRDPIDNPLTSHSLADFWGIDEGIELFGSLQSVEYILAVQNGGHPSLEDGNSDKAITAKLATSLGSGTRASVSAMRTGDLDPKNDRVSEIWFGNNFVVPLGEKAEVKDFNGTFIQADLSHRWTSGNISASAGQGRQETRLASETDTRESTFASVMMKQALNQDWYVAARYSRIESDEGWPIVGQGNFGALFMGEQPTSQIWRASFGLGYQIASGLLLKAEYSIEEGKSVDGPTINDRNLFTFQTAFAF